MPYEQTDHYNTVEREHFSFAYVIFQLIRSRDEAKLHHVKFVNSQVGVKCRIPDRLENS